MLSVPVSAMPSGTLCRTEAAALVAATSSAQVGVGEEVCCAWAVMGMGKPTFVDPAGADVT